MVRNESGHLQLCTQSNCTHLISVDILLQEKKERRKVRNHTLTQRGRSPQVRVSLYVHE
jgi:hypothetical protein